MRLLLRSCGILLGGMGWGLLWMSVFPVAPLDGSLVGVVIAILIAPRSRALLFTAGIAIFSETVSPFSPLVWGVAIFITFGILWIFTRQYISTRTAIGAGVAAVLGIVILEVCLLVFANFFGYFSPGWIPEITRAYFYFLLTRIGVTALATAVSFLILQIFSPGVRGVVISRG